MTGLIPARQPAGQVHALHAAAMLLQHTAITGLTATVDERAFITIHVPGGLGGPPCRAALVTTLAGSADDGYVVRFTCPGSSDRYGIAGYGQMAGHPVTITTPNARARW